MSLPLAAELAILPLLSSGLHIHPSPPGAGLPLPWTLASSYRTHVSAVPGRAGLGPGCYRPYPGSPGLTPVHKLSSCLCGHPGQLVPEFQCADKEPSASDSIRA